MSFFVRPLSTQNASICNLGAYGIPASRIPTSLEWPFAIDENRNALCTQLLSTTPEMRDGCYYYILIWRGKASVFQWESGRLSFSPMVVGAKHNGQEANEALAVVKEASEALAHRNNPKPLIIVSS